MSAPPVKSGTWALEIGRRPPIGIDRKKGAPWGRRAIKMRVQIAFLVLSLSFGFAVLGAAITTTKYIETKQAAKEHSIVVRPTG
jgi:hypothetical protein